MVCNVDDLVDGALQGFPVTVFAFGQTGSVSFRTRFQRSTSSHDVFDIALGTCK